MAEETYGLRDYSTGESTYSTDPVCGAVVEETPHARKVGYAGQMYYFCSEVCMSAFEDDPGKYIGQSH